MPRPKTKDELLSAAEDNYKKLTDIISSMSDEELSTPFDFSGDKSKKRRIGKEIKIYAMCLHIFGSGISF